MRREKFMGAKCTTVFEARLLIRSTMNGVRTDYEFDVVSMDTWDKMNVIRFRIILKKEEKQMEIIFSNRIFFTVTH